MSATKAIEFATIGESAKINYAVPMPGAHTGRRLVELEIDLSNPGATIFTPTASTLGNQLGTLVRVEDNIDETLVRRFFENQLAELQSVKLQPVELQPKTVLAPSLQATPPASPEITELADPDISDAIPTPLPELNVSPFIDPSLAPGIANPPATEPILTPLSTFDFPSTLSVETFSLDLVEDRARVPVADWAGEILLMERPLEVEPEPRFFIVEEYGISSFLGDYGMGRTIKTFTLLPGESTTISLKTWQTTKESRKESSSIIDSHQQSARERFAKKVKSETTDKATRKKAEKWHVEAEVGVSWGFGSAKAKGGGGGEYHAGREQFAKRASAATSEHAAEASSKRELSVTSSSEKTMESGEESLIERTITNVNKRRVLNFVFRELNQTYVTKFHLKDIRIAFSNGLLDSWREVSLAGLRPLLEEVLDPAVVDKAAQQIIRAVARVYDSTGKAVPVLDQVTFRPDGSGADIASPAVSNGGNYAAPTDDMYYRFRSGPLEQDNQSNPVDGVLLDERKIVMRTDSVVVEALLGQADALDNYSMEIQEAAAQKETLANQREKLILDTLSQIQDPVQRAELAIQLMAAVKSSSSENSDG